MTGRKRRHHQPDRVVRARLESLAARVLELRALSAIDRGEDVELDSIVGYAAERLEGNVDHDQDAKYARVWDWRIGELLCECEDLTALVHDFLNRLPIYLVGTPTEVAAAVWTEVLHSEVRNVVDSVIHQVDACGQRRYIELPDGRFAANPDFLPPD